MRRDDHKTHVPNVSMVRETVSHKTKLSFFSVLLDRIERFLLADLQDRYC